MADSILRLKVDSQEYDQKIRRAADGIQQYAQKCREAGGTLEHLDDGVLEFVQSLGKMDTVATGTKQQLREMSNALTTLTQTYRGLTDEEKASPFGQELSKGIQQLTERAGAAKDAMMDVEQSIKNAASDTRMFDQLAQGASVMTAGFQGLTGAGKMLGIEMGNDVEVIAKLQAAMAVTNSLTTIQTALQKQSALMQGVQAAQTAIATAAQTALTTATGNATIAQAAFNAVANMNPYVALATAITAVAGAYLAWTSNANKAKKAQEALNTELDNTKNQLSQIDKDTDFSVGIMQAAGKSWKAIHEVRLEAARTKLQLADMNYDKLAENGASKEQLQKASEMQQQAWDNVMKVLNEGTTHWAKEFYGGGKGSGSGHGKGGSSTSVEKTEEQINSAQIEKLTQEYITATDLRRQAIQEEIAVLQKRNEEISKLKDMALGKSFDAGTVQDVVVTGNKNRQYGTVTNSNINAVIRNFQNEVNSSEIGTVLFDKATEKLADATAFKTIIENAMKAGISSADLGGADIWKKIINGENIPDSTWQSMVDKINEKLKELNIKPIKINFETGNIDNVSNGAKETAANMKSAASAISSVGSALSSIEDPAAKVAGLVAQAIATVAQAYASALATDWSSKSNIYAFIAAAAASTASMIATISSIHSATGYAEGGIVDGRGGGFVGGTAYSGDNIGNVRLDAGELVLNRSQQSNLANALDDNRGGGGYTPSHISGEQIWIAVNRFAKRTGKGELVTWK